MKIYISGLYCGTNPQPGVGIARSLRTAYPHATLIGVEYSTRCSGIHWQDFDEIWLQRPWNELDLAAHAAKIKQILDAGGLWISGIDLEIIWFAEVFPDRHPNLLAPPKPALQMTAKPAVTARGNLPVKIPPFVTTELSDWDLHAFCRRYDWKIWLKGPYYEAVKAKNWMEFEEIRDRLANAWSTDLLYAQSHVGGYEESIAFCAYEGELLDSALMRKRDLTEINKTWAGDVSPVSAAMLEPLREIVRRINWTGGAELEMIRDTGGDLWLLEWNPRFPAWIYGATIAGCNLPARLVESASGIEPRTSAAIGEEFTRVVLEIPVRADFPLPPLPEPFAGKVGHSLKHPSGLLDFANALRDGRGGAIAQGKSIEYRTPEIPDSFTEDVSKVEFQYVSTPSWIFLETTTARLFKRAADLTEKHSNGVNVINAYSLKTNPDARLIQSALENGFLAETISPLEVNKALEIGFPPERIVLNGPGKWWRGEHLPDAPLHAVFCDSNADLQRLVIALETKKLRTEYAGIRLRAPNVESRFGISVATPDELKSLIESIKTLPRTSRFGVHFHTASSTVGVRQWWRVFESMLRWCGSIEALTGRIIEVLDIGGGWFPDDWHENADEYFADATQSVKEFLPHVEQIISEPGKALAQPSMALATRILDVRTGEKEIVIDGSIAELPMCFFYPHRILHRSRHTGKWNALKRGKTKILGRLCMEHDVVASGVELPEDAENGDILIFCDAGAYDRSMSYAFGRG